MQISANGIALEIEDHGSPQGEPLLLIMGLGMQLLGWHEDFVANLVARGFRVIRFDNRDIGLSQGFDAAGVPNLALDSLRFALGLRVKSPYTLGDMAADSVAVLDVLGIDKAHVCGASMGGMIAQRLAARYPERVKSLTLMMTSSGARRLPGPSLKVRGAMISRPKDQRLPSIVEHYVDLYGADRQPGVSARQGLPARALHALDQALLSARPERRGRWWRSPPTATGRRCSARCGRRPTSSTAPSIRWCRSAAGRDLGARIPGATLDVIDGMGHDLPKELWPRFVAGIAGRPRAPEPEPPSRPRGHCHRPTPALGSPIVDGGR